MNAPAPPLLPPGHSAVSRIGRFYIMQELGRGTVGCVYLGHDPVVGRDVALKTFNPGLTLTEKSRYEQQFINEARAAGRLSHPNIVTIYDASIEGNEPYIVMEYLQGRELDKLLEQGQRFTLKAIASIALRIADALDHAHCHGVVHRDLKPANIFMVNDEQPKLIDFGIARAPNRANVKNAEWAHTLFTGDNLLGTPNYMSPEQAMGKPVDFRTDIYSLGAVMYEMLTGQKPFHSDDAKTLLNLITHKDPRPPSEIDRKIPAPLSRIVMKAMTRQPEKRYESAEQMALDLKRFLRHEKRARRRMESAASPLEQNGAARPEKKQHALFWMGCLAIAVAIVLAGVSLWH